MQDKLALECYQDLFSRFMEFVLSDLKQSVHLFSGDFERKSLSPLTAVTR